MIVCQCKGTTDVAVKKVIRNGARTIGEISAACLAGTECEGCHDTLIQILKSEIESEFEDAESAVRNTMRPPN
jgi:bacterioferritin-associated ferredoxin